MSRLLLCAFFVGPLVLAVASSSADDYIYWTAGDATAHTSVVRRARTDGTSVQTLASFSSAHVLTLGIAVDIASGYVYYGVDSDAGLSYSYIARANLDGTNPVNLINTYTTDIQLDLVHGKIYWSNTWQGNPGNRGIFRANVDGSNVEKLLSYGPYEGIYGLAIDPLGGKVYYTRATWPEIREICSCNLDGTGNATVRQFGVEEYPLGLGIDVGSGKVYWVDRAGNAIREANLDGSGGVQTLCTPIGALNFGMCLDVVNQYVYFPAWNDSLQTSDLRRVNTDGTGLTTIVTLPDYIYYLALARNVGPVNPFALSDFKEPMGLKKKLGSTLPVKFQLFQGDAEVQTPEQIGQALGLDTAVWPRILLYDATDLATELGIDLPEDGNVGEGGDLGDCFRSSDGNWIFNLRLNAPIYAPGSFLVKVKVGDIILEPGNGMFQTK